MLKDYMELKQQYPEYISKEQFYKIAHISKGTAAELLQKGIVPCVKSPKTTHRYSIAIDDVIVYLQRKDRMERIRKHHNISCPKITNCSELKWIYDLSPTERKEFRNYLSVQMEDCNDLISIDELCAFLEISRKRPEFWFKEKVVYGFWYYNRVLFPKSSLLDFFSDSSSIALLASIPKYIDFVFDYYAIAH